MTKLDHVDALLFDLGGVVMDIDFERVVARWAAHADCDVALLRARFAHDEAYKRHEVGELGTEGYFDSLRASLGVNLSDAQLLDGWNAIFAGELPGISELLARAAKHLPLYAFSNTNAAHEAYWSVHFAEALRPFKTIFVSSTIRLRKPDAAAFRFVVDAIGLPGERILFFDDGLPNIEGARACGLQTVHVTSVGDVANALAALGL